MRFTVRVEEPCCLMCPPVYWISALCKFQICARLSFWRNPFHLRRSVWIINGMMLTGWDGIAVRDSPATQPLCPSQILHVAARKRTRISAVGHQRLTPLSPQPWFISRPFRIKRGDVPLLLLVLRGQTNYSYRPTEPPGFICISRASVKNEKVSILIHFFINFNSFLSLENNIALCHLHV